MSTLKALNEAMDYIENQLDQKLDLQKIARISQCAGGLFPRVFSLLTSLSFGEYIRLRRLSKAALDLVQTNEKIIDIACKYEYDSVDAFAAAFKKFHGNTPSAVRKGAPFQNFSPLYFSFELKGGAKMNMRFEKKAAFKIAGVSGNDGTKNDFNGLWQLFTTFWTKLKICVYCFATVRTKV